MFEKAKWISDGTYIFKDKGVSPRPMTFRKKLAIDKPLKNAYIFATAMGIYKAYINGNRVGEDYFTPGFTSYKHNLQYQRYDIMSLLTSGENTLHISVAGGWAVGSFVFTRKNRIAADRQALLAQIELEYEDGTKELIATDESWMVSMDGGVLSADLYDGEAYDARIADKDMTWRFATQENLRVHPEICKAYGSPVKAHERFTAKKLGSCKDAIVYDFEQNFAGIVELKIKNAADGQRITVHHAEVLHPDGSLNTDFLRTAKATLSYICKEGDQVYSPTFTYMGFRYISVEGIDESELTVTGIALYSDIKENGSFECSNPMINRLQQNILWGARSNFVDIPTDCPQRDERMGWTGDIAVFAPTAVYNFDISDFLKKWLKDMRAEQLKTGGIPNTIPSNGYGFPATMPTMAIDFWGDAAVLVPWALYQATADISVLSDNYEMMKKYVNACKGWASLLSFGYKRYIWHTPHFLHFGDWVAADAPLMSQWQKRSKWTATASLYNTSSILAKVAGILGNHGDAVKYQDIASHTKEAYEKAFFNEDGKLIEEFQTGYVLPIYFDMLKPDTKKKAAAALARLVKNNDYCIGTGFPGTPYILFALADNGYEDVAYRMLLNDKCPSWLYEVKLGATTIWERWDGLDENGSCPIGDDGTDTMISYNHYASGAVGDFLYRRVLGLEATKPGYEEFIIKPVVGDGIDWAKGHVDTPFGTIRVSWKKEGSAIKMDLTVPEGTTARVCINGENTKELAGGSYSF